jgi:hypothetical protein
VTSIRVVCPKCGRVGILKLRTYTRRSGRYTYLVILHCENGTITEHSLGPVQVLADDLELQRLVEKLTLMYRNMLEQELKKLRDRVLSRAVPEELTTAADS